MTFNDWVALGMDDFPVQLMLKNNIFIWRYLYIVIMGKMNIVLNDILEEKFRRTVSTTKGYKKGNISQAIAEALEKWIQEQEELSRK